MEISEELRAQWVVQGMDVLNHLRYITNSACRKRRKGLVTFVVSTGVEMLQLSCQKAGLECFEKWKIM